MSIPVFLSFPTPFNDNQAALVEAVSAQLRERGLEPRTLGVNEYDNEVPLRAVRRMLIQSNGLLTLGLRRYWVDAGSLRRTFESTELRDRWFTSPWPHMETAMGYQMGLPILVLREAGVHADGVFERGTVEVRIHEIDCAHASAFLKSPNWHQPLAAWERDVRTVAKNRGEPPKLY